MPSRTLDPHPYLHRAAHCTPSLLETTLNTPGTGLVHTPFLRLVELVPPSTSVGPAESTERRRTPSSPPLPRAQRAPYRSMLRQSSETRLALRCHAHPCEGISVAGDWPPTYDALQDSTHTHSTYHRPPCIALSGYPTIHLRASRLHFLCFTPLPL